MSIESIKLLSSNLKFTSILRVAIDEILVGESEILLQLIFDTPFQHACRGHREHGFYQRSKFKLFCQTNDAIDFTANCSGVLDGRHIAKNEEKIFSLNSLDVVSNSRRIVKCCWRWSICFHAWREAFHLLSAVTGFQPSAVLSFSLRIGIGMCSLFEGGTWISVVLLSGGSVVLEVLLGLSFSFFVGISFSVSFLNRKIT